ncbi:MAG: HNH endonuclease signature motif containing protein [Candidatus Eisenbacteria bacterium]
MRREHRASVTVLDVLGEIDHRNLYLDQGYSSLFDFCTRRWNYSNATAARYIAAARAAARYPIVRSMLLDRRLTVCGVARIASSLTPENHRELVSRAAGKTYLEIEALVATGRTAPRVPDRVRVIGTGPRRAASSDATLTLAMRGDEAGAGAGAGLESASAPAAAPAHGAGAGLDGAVQVPGVVSSPRTHIQRESEGCFQPDIQHDRTETTGHSHIQRDRKTRADRDRPAVVPSAVAELRYEIRFSARQQFVEKLERAKAVCSRRADLAGVLERALDDLLDRRDPERLSKRRTDRSASADLRETNGASGEAERQPSREPDGEPCPRSRYIPATVRDSVFLRDGGRCTFVGPSGVQCSARAFLQIDHVVPFSDGGGHAHENLRLLCGKHNRRRESGRE